MPVAPLKRISLFAFGHTFFTAIAVSAPQLSSLVCQAVQRSSVVRVGVLKCWLERVSCGPRYFLPLVGYQRWLFSLTEFANSLNDVFLSY